MLTSSEDSPVPGFTDTAHLRAISCRRKSAREQVRKGGVSSVPLHSERGSIRKSGWATSYKSTFHTHLTTGGRHRRNALHWVAAQRNQRQGMHAEGMPSGTSPETGFYTVGRELLLIVEFVCIWPLGFWVGQVRLLNSGLTLIRQKWGGHKQKKNSLSPIVNLFDPADVWLCVRWVFSHLDCGGMLWSTLPVLCLAVLLNMHAVLARLTLASLQSCALCYQLFSFSSLGMLA